MTGRSARQDTPPRKGSRSKARKRALDILFESEARAEDPLDVLRRRIAGSDAPPVSDFAQTLVEGVVAHREHIDASLGEMARGWSVERMAAVDRAILRIGAYEVLFTDDVDDAVAIDEAILLARELSTDDSPRFVNGVLAGCCGTGRSSSRSRRSRRRSRRAAFPPRLAAVPVAGAGVLVTRLGYGRHGRPQRGGHRWSPSGQRAPRKLRSSRGDQGCWHALSGRPQPATRRKRTNPGKHVWQAVLGYRSLRSRSTAVWSRSASSSRCSSGF